MNTIASDTLLCLSTAPDKETAESLASALVSSRLAACVSILPAVTSMYHWNGAIEKASECMLFCKTTAALRAELQETLASLHPYEVPEILFFTIDSGLPEYLRWVSLETKKE